jgi:hypothetical protein
MTPTTARRRTDRAGAAARRSAAALLTVLLLTATAGCAAGGGTGPDASGGASSALRGQVPDEILAEGILPADFETGEVETGTFEGTPFAVVRGRTSGALEATAEQMRAAAVAGGWDVVHEWGGDDVFAGFTADRSGDYLNVMLSINDPGHTDVLVELKVP